MFIAFNRRLISWQALFTIGLCLNNDSSVTCNIVKVQKDGNKTVSWNIIGSNHDLLHILKVPGIKIGYYHNSNKFVQEIKSPRIKLKKEHCLEFVGIALDDSGEYYAVQNEVIVGDNITVFVYGTPTNATLSTNQTHLSCDSTSTSLPAKFRPPSRCNYEFMNHPNITIINGSCSGELIPIVFPDQGKSPRATARCHMYEEGSITRSPDSNPVPVQLLYGPYGGEIFPQPTSLTCHYKCNPRCTYAWFVTESNDSLATEAILHLRNRTWKEDEAIYCRASNLLAQTTINTTVHQITDNSKAKPATGGASKQTVFVSIGVPLVGLTVAVAALSLVLWRKTRRGKLVIKTVVLPPVTEDPFSDMCDNNLYDSNCGASKDQYSESGSDLALYSELRQFSSRKSESSKIVPNGEGKYSAIKHDDSDTNNPYQKSIGY